MRFRHALGRRRERRPGPTAAAARWRTMPARAPRSASRVAHRAPGRSDVHRARCRDGRGHGSQDVKLRAALKSCSSRRATRQTAPPGRPMRGPRGRSTAARIAGSCTRRKGFVARSSAIVVGSVATPARALGLRARLAVAQRGASQVRPRARSEGSTRCIRDRSRCVVASGNAASLPSDATICAGVPSNNRPQPAANSVSPQKTMSWPTSAIWPAVCPGISSVDSGRSDVRARRSRRLLRARACDREWPRVRARTRVPASARAGRECRRRDRHDDALR